MAELEKNLLDSRVRNINLKRGRINRKDVDEHIASLPDDSDWAEELIVYEEETEDLTSDIDESSLEDFSFKPEDPENL